MGRYLAERGRVDVDWDLVGEGCEWVEGESGEWTWPRVRVRDLVGDMVRVRREGGGHVRVLRGNFPVEMQE